MSWQPIVTDPALAARCRAAVDDIAAAVTAAPSAGWDLADGDAGVAVFAAWLAHAEPDRHGALADVAAARIEAATDQLATAPAALGLWQGATGVGWAGDQVRALLGEPDPDVNAELDDLLAEALAVSPWELELDLIAGLVGIGVYARDRPPGGAGERCVAHIVDRLAERARTEPDGIAWWTPPEHLGATGRSDWPGGHWDLGVAHGVAGVIAWLAGVVAGGGPGHARARDLLDGAVAWLLARRHPELASTFSAKEAPGVPIAPARAAWCYGDPGVALAVAAAAHATARADWRADAVAIARRASARPATECGVVDAQLCHGAAGLALIFARLHQLTGDAALGDAAAGWIERALAARDPDRAYAASAGFYTVTRGDRTATTGLLGGAAGVGLVLAAATSAIEPRWDHCLLTRPG